MVALSNLRSYFNSQLCVTLPIPTKSFANQIIIITGSNTGMGLEAARYLVRLEAAKVILAVRSLPRGQAAAESILASEKRPGVVEVWELDLTRYASVEAFAQRVYQTLPRLDVVVANAGVFHFKFEMAEQDEANITVNVVSHMLLALLLLPKLRETATMAGKAGVFTFTGSFTHWMTEFPERRGENIFRDLAVKEKARMGEQRYYVSKLIQLLLMREFADHLTKSIKPGKVITSVINPGFVATEIMRHGNRFYQVYLKIMRGMLARTSEEGGRTLVHAAEGAEETHGQYLDDCHVGVPSEFVRSAEGHVTQEQLWRELMAKLERIHPGITGNL